MVMKFFRKKRNLRIIMWVTAILIIPGFLIWGVGIGGSGRARYLAATVNRKGITQREFYRQLSETEQNYRRLFGERFDEIAKHLNLEKGVLEELIRQELLLQQAGRRHIRVSDSEVVEAVKADPAFRDEKGNFNQEKFSRVIASIPPDELEKIEDATRERLRLQKLKQQVVAEADIKVTDQEVADYLAKNKTGGDADKEQVRKMLVWQKEEKYFRDWYSRLRNQAKVVTYIAIQEPAPTPPVTEGNAPAPVPSQESHSETAEAPQPSSRKP